ncbi:DUF1269 domain-containing protein [Paraburkholderia acidiphila]|uniref:DUF1269 domain-containing protein n=1 Tax=Paraburkholderia acidiphila TaxID=2571747 RepID=A0A7Z2GE76_9BURK|nr:DUF1269 domain-containing protein [Paraburkholderia acidiphila]QGZ59734.1 DUF1269 domain-containing protein [Paraburkholderia acidiphila]
MSQELIVAVFGNVSDAEGAAWAIRKLEGEDTAFKVNSGVMAEKDLAGKVSLLGTKTNPFWGVVIGAVTGSLIGLLGGPSGAILGFTIGASAGLAGVALHDILDHEFIDAIGRDFPPGSVAIILEASEVSPTAVNAIVVTHRGVVHRKPISQ